MIPREQPPTRGRSAASDGCSSLPMPSASTEMPRALTTTMTAESDADLLQEMITQGWQFPHHIKESVVMDALQLTHYIVEIGLGEGDEGKAHGFSIVVCDTEEMMAQVKGDDEQDYPVFGCTHNDNPVFGKKDIYIHEQAKLLP